MVVEAVTAAGPGFGYARLVIEVTETGVLGDTDVANKALRELCDLGVTIALDDFGTGYSSLSHLQRLPITVLKIDLSFVQRVAENAGDATIVRSIVQLASAMNMRTVAEGVETREQVRLLRDMGCAAGQGWFWGTAMSLQELGELLRSQPGGRFDVDQRDSASRSRSLGRRGATSPDQASVTPGPGRGHGRRWLEWSWARSRRRAG
jgi:EAL domain-containing protein (putative c-di-GMP-specific phosphodiesterase class I)